MPIYTNFLSVNHQLNVISNFKNKGSLPFNEVLSKEEIMKHLEDIDLRVRIYTPEVTLWALLSQVTDDDQTQQAAVARVIAASIAQGGKPPSANTSAYSQARSRLSEAILATLTRDAAKQMLDGTPDDWLWRGRRIKLIDGTTVSMPDTLENQAVYPQPDSQKKGLGFPIARIVAIIDYITGVVLDVAIGPYSGKKTGEHALLRQLMHSFNAGEIILGDCYYPSFFLMATLIRLGVDGIFPIHASRKHDFRRGKRLGEKDHIAQWKKPSKPEWMEQAEYDEFPIDISVREIAITTETKGKRSKTRVLVTTFLNPQIISKLDLAGLYNYRWFVELTLRSIKETLHMDILRGKTPEMVRKEMWGYLLAYNLIRKVMAQSAFLHDRPVATLSFKLTLQMIKAFQSAGILNNNNPDAYGQLLNAIAYKKVGNRPGRHEPRSVKRRPKAFPRLQDPRVVIKNAA